MAVNAFLKIDDLKGDSVVKGYEDFIQVSSWNWGMSNGGTSHRGGGAGRGRTQVEDFTFTHEIDPSSPELMEACMRGSHFDEATLVVRKAGGKEALDYLTITMEEVLVTNVTSSGVENSDGDIESITLNFAKVEIKYQGQGKDGGPKGGAITKKYDIAQDA